MLPSLSVWHRAVAAGLHVTLSSEIEFLGAGRHGPDRAAVHQQGQGGRRVQVRTPSICLADQPKTTARKQPANRPVCRILYECVRSFASVREHGLGASRAGCSVGWSRSIGMRRCRAGAFAGGDGLRRRGRLRRRQRAAAGPGGRTRGNMTIRTLSVHSHLRLQLLGGGAAEGRGF